MKKVLSMDEQLEATQAILDVMASKGIMSLVKSMEELQKVYVGTVVRLIMKDQSITVEQLEEKLNINGFNPIIKHWEDNLGNTISKLGAILQGGLNVNENDFNARGLHKELLDCLYNISYDAYKLLTPTIFKTTQN